MFLRIIMIKINWVTNVADSIKYSKHLFKFIMKAIEIIKARYNRISGVVGQKLMVVVSKISFLSTCLIV